MAEKNQHNFLQMKSIEEFINLVDEISNQITEMENVER